MWGGGGGVSEFLSYRVTELPSFTVSLFPSFQVGGREGDGPMRGLGTDHVISGPMRGAKKLHPMAKQTNSQTDMATLRLNWPSGADSVKT